jgi:alpha-1,2-mannosyltransferase
MGDAKIARLILFARAATLLWVVAVVVPLAVLNPPHPDFPQLYMAGVVAWEGQWPALYAEPIEGTSLNPAYTQASVPHPEYERLRLERGVPDQLRFIYPPPAAVLMMPFGAVSYSAALIIFALFSGLAVWGMSIQAGWIYRKFMGKRTWVEAGLMVAGCCSPATIHAVSAMNISLLIGIVIGSAALAILRNKPGEAFWAIPMSGVFKATSFPLALILLAMGRWRTLLGVVAVSAGIIGFSLMMVGVEPFERFFNVIAPAVAGKTTPEFSNQSIAGFVSRQGIYDVSVGRWIGLAGLTVIGWVAWRVFRIRRSMEQHPEKLVAAMYVGLLAMMLCGPMFWTHYQLVLLPMWSLLAWDILWQWRDGGRAWAVVLVICWLNLLVPAIVWLGPRFSPPPLWLSEHVLIATLILLIRYLWLLAKPGPAAT